MKKVEFIYEKNCPNVEKARALLLKAFSEAKHSSTWKEWEQHDPNAPEYVKYYGSPTILVNGQDVDGLKPSEIAQSSCRVYTSKSGDFNGVPDMDKIVNALHRSVNVSGKPKGGFLGIIVAIPGILASLLPAASCPLCWGAWAGVLSAAGFSFLFQRIWIIPLMIIFLSISLFAMGHRARQRHGFGPLTAGIVATIFMFIGKFVWPLGWLLYIGVGMLLIASIWNTWPRMKATPKTCPACR